MGLKLTILPFKSAVMDDYVEDADITSTLIFSPSIKHYY